MLRILLVSLFFSISAASMAQQQPPDSTHLFSTPTRNVCSNDMILYNLRKNPAYVLKEEQMNRAILNSLRNLNVNITLPVVVHIINPAPNSISDLQVISGINDLNDAFGKTGNYSGSAGVDTKIRFCLA